MDTTAERVAKNEAAFRDANERIEEAADRMPHLDAIPLICECSVQTCTEVARITREDYEFVRSNGAWFWVVPGHEIVTVDGVDVAEVRERREGFTILEKIGDASVVARQLDPRSQAKTPR
jgi:hypothetical protein